MSADEGPPGAAQRYLVTGALGCIGAWVVRTLLADGREVVALDPSPDDHRLAAAIADVPTEGLTRVAGDVTDLDAVEHVVGDHGIEAIIHLAALQVPAVAAKPILGAQVNVVGMAVILEVMARHAISRPLAYASSIAAYDAADEGTQGDGDLAGRASTLYGVYKRANEGAASVYWSNQQVPSIGLRPYVVYGPGRDFGMTAEPTFAMAAAARGDGYHITYGGTTRMQFVEDVARAFCNATQSPHSGATVVNVGGDQVSMAEVVSAIESVVPEAAGSITFDDRQLPFPSNVESSMAGVLEEPAATSLLEGTRRTIDFFRTA